MITNDTANICLLFISHFYLQFKSSWLWGAERPVSLNKTDFKAHTIYMYIYMTFRSFIMSSPILPTSLIETSYQYLAAWKKTSAGASRHHPSLYFGLQLFLQLLRLTKHQLTGKVGWSLNCLPVSTHRKASVEPKNWWVCWCFSFSKRRIFSASMLVFGTTVTNNLIPTRTADMNFGTCLYRIEPFLIPSGESWIAHNPWEARNQLRQPQPTRHFGVENVESCCQSSGNFSISGTIRRLTAPGLADGNNLVKLSLWVEFSTPLVEWLGIPGNPLAPSREKFGWRGRGPGKRRIPCSTCEYGKDTWTETNAIHNNCIHHIRTVITHISLSPG